MFSEAHRLRVMVLYRRALSSAADWSSFKLMLRPRQLHIRERFEVNRHLKNPRLVAMLLQQTEEELEQTAHPEPIVHPYAPNGIAFNRQYTPSMEHRYMEKY